MVLLIEKVIGIAPMRRYVLLYLMLKYNPGSGICALKA